jgi:hypothetical protein
MNPRELVDHIRSGPSRLVLDKPLRFRRRTRSNPCDIDEFLQALQSSETIRDVSCFSHQALGITEDEWVLLVQTLGSIKGIRDLTLDCSSGSYDFQPFQAVADAVNNAQSLSQILIVLQGEAFPRDQSGLIALAGALQQHTTLQIFSLIDLIDQPEAAPVDLSFDLVLRALPACPHLREVIIKTKNASAGAMKYLLQLPKDTVLSLLHTNQEQWLAVADGIRQGQCNVKHLTLLLRHQSSSSESTEAVKAIASAIREDRTLEDLTLRMGNAFTDEAGVVLAEALTVNKTLLRITLSFIAMFGGQVQGADAMSAPAYNAFSAMLRVNTSLRLEVPPSDDAVGDQRLVDSRNQMRIEQRLNRVGRGRLLSSSQTPRKEWVDALDELNSRNVDESPKFNISCLYSLLRLNPATCIM